MKTFVDFLFQSVRLLAAVAAGLITGWLWLDAHFDQKVKASETRVFEKVNLMREGDLAIIKSIKEDTSLIKQELMRRK